MRRWELQGGFGADHAALIDVDRPPEPGPGEVTLDMRAWSLNYRDLLMRDGSYDPRLAFPWIPLSDGAGEVIAVGDGVTRVALGDRVCPTFSPSWIDGPPDPHAVRRTRGGPVPGVLAEQITLPEAEVVRVAPHLSWEEAATLPCAALTAHSALELGQVDAGDTVLVLGSGGVSVWALQLAVARGARVIATTSSARKADQLEALGAERVVRYDEEARWGRVARRWAGQGVDCVIEVGGAGTLGQSLDATRVGGTVAVIGVVAGSAESVSVLPILMKQLRCQGVFVGHRTGLEALVSAITTHRIRPVVDRVFPFEDWPAAMAYLGSGAHVGKVCLTRA